MDVKQIENELDQIFGLNLQLSPIDIDKVNLADKELIDIKKMNIIIQYQY